MEKVFCAIYCLLPAWIMACLYDRDDDYNGFYGCGCVYKTYSPRSWQQYVPWFWMRMDRWPTALHLCTCNAIWFMGEFIWTRSWLVVDARGPMTSCSASVSAPSVNHAPFVGFLAPAANVVCCSSRTLCLFWVTRVVLWRCALVLLCPTLCNVASKLICGIIMSLFILGHTKL